MDRKQFTAYVESTQEALRRFLVALCCGDAALADDLAQETYIKAYLSCDGFLDDQKFAAWIRRIAFNTFVSYRRSVRLTVSIDDAVNCAIAPQQSDSAFQYQALYNALARLSEKERTAVVLFYLEGYAVKEIAQIVEGSEDSVRQQLSRGRVHLKHLLTAS